MVYIGQNSSAKKTQLRVVVCDNFGVKVLNRQPITGSKVEGSRARSLDKAKGSAFRADGKAPRRRAERPEDEAPQAPPPPLGGPLGLHATPAPSRPAVAPVAAPEAARLVDRMVVGQTRDGLPEVRMDVAAGGLHGTEIRLLAGRHGVEATFVAATESARRVVEAQLADLARALEGRGVKLARCEVTDAGRERRDRPRQGRGGRPRPAGLEDGID